MGLVKQKQLMDEASPSLRTIFGFALLSFNSAMAVYWGNRDWGAILYVGFSFLVLVALFYGLRLYIKTAPGSPRREHLKMAIWLLTTMITIAFFVSLEYFFFPNTADIGAKSGSAPDPQDQYPPLIP